MADTYNVNPTRMELKKMKIRYANARRGHKLLKDKRDGLMKQFLETVRQNKELREKVEASLQGVYGSLSIAGAVSGPAVLEESLMLPKTQGKLDVRYKNVMSVTVPEFTMEGMGKMFSSRMKGIFYKSLLTKLGALTVKKPFMQFRKDFDAKEHGGSPILGLRKPVIKAHGSSDARAFKNAIRQAMKFAESGATATIEELLGTAAPAGKE